MSESRYKIPESQLAVHLIEDRRASVSPWGRGNSKLGPTLYTYSKLPGARLGSCPGSTEECEAICYAKRLVSNPWVWRLLQENTARGNVLPPVPPDAKLVRFHVSGDFDTSVYVRAWIQAAVARPDVTFFGYTRSWRVPDLLESLQIFRGLPNVFLWASIDSSMVQLPPRPWRRAWIEGDSRLTQVTSKSYRTFDGRKAIICLEEAGLMANCEECTFCFRKGITDLVFLRH